MRLPWVCTLVGTSTNLVVNGLWVGRGGGHGLQMFDLAWVGIPCALAGIGTLVLLSPKLLPDRRPALQVAESNRRYFVDMIVAEDGPIAGRTIEEASLRGLTGLFLVEVEREGQLLPAVRRREKLFGGDRVSFVGDVHSIVDLQQMEGLRPTESEESPTAKSRRELIEAVVSDRCPLVGKTIREGQFRAFYDAAVVAIARGAEKMKGKVGDVELRIGDTLLLEAGSDFLDRFRHSPDFFLVSGVDGMANRRTHRAPIAIALLIGMVAVSALGWCQLLTAACIAAVAVVALGCCTSAQARESIDWSLLVTIAASLGIGVAIQESGLASTLSSGVISFAGSSPWLALAAVYLVTMVLTELITNNAAAVLVYPLAISTAASLDVSEAPFIVCIMIAASAGFATPFGYQTNLMVYGPGGYRFSDYVRLGVPLDLAFMAVTVLVTPWAFPFAH
ncbi:MAG: SLC13 family permease [Pirellulales bacterium]